MPNLPCNLVSRAGISKEPWAVLAEMEFTYEESLHMGPFPVAMINEPC